MSCLAALWMLLLFCINIILHACLRRSHQHVFENSRDTRPYDLDLAANSKTIRQFDDAITRVSFGWPSVAEYYQGSGSCHSIPHVRIPLLCLQVCTAMSPQIRYADFVTGCVRC